MEKVIAYIDGYNLYYGLRGQGWKRFYWLNLQKLSEQFLRPTQTLVRTKYFTTIVKQPEDKRLRQQVFLEALQTLPDLDIYYGHFLSDEIICRKCGHTYTTHHEKMTDVNISVELMMDAFQDLFDVAFLISADSDLVSPVGSNHQKDRSNHHNSSESSSPRDNPAKRLTHDDQTGQDIRGEKEKRQAFWLSMPIPYPVRARRRLAANQIRDEQHVDQGCDENATPGLADPAKFGFQDV